MDVDRHQLAERLHALGARLSAADVDAIAPLLRPRPLAPGDVLVAEGAPSRATWLLLHGGVAVKTRVHAEDVALGKIGAGALVGEVSFLDGGPATATVVADEPTMALELDRDAFAQLDRTHPHAATELLHALSRTLAGRLRSATDELEAIRSSGPEAATAHGGFLSALRELLGVGKA